MNYELAPFSFSLETENRDLEDELPFVTAAIRDIVCCCWDVNLIHMTDKDVADM